MINNRNKFKYKEIIEKMGGIFPKAIYELDKQENIVIVKINHF
jgi:hypothetical protein